VPASSQGLMVLDGQVIRDARLDAYFEAHRGAVGPVPSAMPGGALRSVEILVPQR
jgi:sigma-E factor negative regulatory protein RseA